MLEEQCLQGQNSQLVLTNCTHMQGVGGSRMENSKALPNFRCQSHDTKLPYVKGERSGRMEEIDYNGFLVKKLQCPSYGFLYCSSVILSHQCITINQLAHTIFHLESSYACTLSPI